MSWYSKKRNLILLVLGVALVAVVISYTVALYPLFMPKRYSLSNAVLPVDRDEAAHMVLEMVKVQLADDYTITAVTRQTQENEWVVQVKSPEDPLGYSYRLTQSDSAVLVKRYRTH